MKQTKQALQFIEYFCSGEIENLESLLSDDFHLHGPLGHFTSRDTYIESLKQDPPEKSTYTILKIFEAGNEVCVAYEYAKSEIYTIIVHFYKFSGHKITELLLVFDSRALLLP